MTFPEPRPNGARAYIDRDFCGRIAIHLRPHDHAVFSFDTITTVHKDPENYGTALAADAKPLTLEEDAARALYEALAEHFGHTGHDMRALRKDFDHEKGRVDRLIGVLIDHNKALALPSMTLEAAPMGGRR